MSKLAKLLAGSAVALCLGFAGLNSAQAGGYGHGYAPAPHCHYEWVTTWQFRKVKDVIYVTDYDCYGQPVQVAKVIWKTVKFPVRTAVKVCH